MRLRGEERMARSCSRCRPVWRLYRKRKMNIGKCRPHQICSTMVTETRAIFTMLTIGKEIISSTL